MKILCMFIGGVLMIPIAIVLAQFLLVAFLVYCVVQFITEGVSYVASIFPAGHQDNISEDLSSPRVYNPSMHGHGWRQ